MTHFRDASNRPDTDDGINQSYEKYDDAQGHHHWKNIGQNAESFI